MAKVDPIAKVRSKEKANQKTLRLVSSSTHDSAGGRSNVAIISCEAMDSNVGQLLRLRSEIIRNERPVQSQAYRSSRTKRGNGQEITHVKQSVDE